MSIRKLLVTSFSLVTLSAAVHLMGVHAQTANTDLPPVVHLTSEQDHQRTMDLLKMTSIRNGRNGSNPKDPNYANYDETKANIWTNYPNALVLNNGKPVTSSKMWWDVRRPQIVELFDREIYGRVPKVMPSVHWEVVSTTAEKNGDIPIVTKKLIGHVDNSSYPLVTVDIEMNLSTPANAPGPVPVIIEFGNTRPFVPRPGGPGGPGGPRPGAAGAPGAPGAPGVTATTVAPGAPAAAAAPARPARPAGPPAPTGPSWQQQVLAKGWGYAELSPASIQADNGAGLTEGIIGLMNKGQPRKLDDWGSLRAWAWGAGRALDYLETDRDVNAKMVGIEGHSRYGKATIVTMAYEQRFAVAFVSSSGEGGAKMLRRNWGEVVENVAGTQEYHWMAGNFLKYAGPLTPKDLPVDANELVALCAPRPTFISGGATQGDGWVDAHGMFIAAELASPVWTLLGHKGLSAKDFPPMETPAIDGDLAFRQHAGGHTPVPNWPTFITFASRYIEALQPRPARPAQGGN
jgi:hypothetical protein